MRRLLVPALIMLTACSSGDEPSLSQPSPTPTDLQFRVISEEQNATFCVEGPEFAVAATEDEWVDIYSRQSDCQPGGDFSLPNARFTHPSRPEVVLAAWWKVEGCLGYDVETQSVQRVGPEVVVRATSTGPGEGQACATALGSLESFLAVPEDALDGAAVVRFFLNDEQLGSVDLSDG